jgi:hypothetical protein
MDIKNKVKGCFSGLAYGDVADTTLWFRQRGTFDPLSDMMT